MTPRTSRRAPAAAAKRRAGLGASIGGDCRLLRPMAETCYRHPDRETRVSCSSCGRPICPDCMTPTPVGMRCPECASQRTRVVRNPTGTPSGFGATPATYALIAINVIVFLIEVLSGPGGLSVGVASTFFREFALFGPSVAEGEWYRLVTSG